MNQSRFYYQLISSLIFLGMAAFILFAPESFSNLSGGLRALFVGLLITWGVFRGYMAYLLWKKSKRNSDL